MFCPHCGKSEQQPDAYCKGCGKYLYRHSWTPSDAPADKAAWLVVFSAITLLVCLIGEVYPASKLSSNPAFPSIIIIQLFSMLVAYSLRRRLRRKRGDSNALPRQQEPAGRVATKIDGLLPSQSTTVTEQTTKVLDAIPIETNDGT